jgi:predicted transcriptional regulator
MNDYERIKSGMAALQQRMLKNPDPPRARNSDPETSHNAEEVIAPSVNELRTVVLSTLKQHGGLTSHEVADVSGHDWGSISPRFTYLVDIGLVEDSGERRKWVNPATGKVSKAPSTVWRLCDPAKSRLSDAPFPKSNGPAQAQRLDSQLAEIQAELARA